MLCGLSGCPMCRGYCPCWSWWLVALCSVKGKRPKKYTVKKKTAHLHFLPLCNISTTAMLCWWCLLNPVHIAEIWRWSRRPRHIKNKLWKEKMREKNNTWTHIIIMWKQQRPSLGKTMYFMWTLISFCPWLHQHGGKAYDLNWSQPPEGDVNVLASLGELWSPDCADSDLFSLFGLNVLVATPHNFADMIATRVNKFPSGFFYGGNMSLFFSKPSGQKVEFVNFFCCFCMIVLSDTSSNPHPNPPVSLSPPTAKEYVDSDPSGRRGLPITTIKQGAEPPTFTGWFQAWDPKMWETDPLDRIRARFWMHNPRLFHPVWLFYLSSTSCCFFV